jgi:hypothetical protein
MPASFKRMASSTAISSKGIHAHLHIRGINTGLVRFDSNLDVVINNALHRNQNFHGTFFVSSMG